MHGEGNELLSFSLQEENAESEHPKYPRDLLAANVGVFYSEKQATIALAGTRTVTSIVRDRKQ